jgi:hypothetical protein
MFILPCIIQIEQSLATRHSPTLARGNTRKREDSVITTVILETLKELFNTDNSQTDKKKMRLSISNERLKSNRWRKINSEPEYRTMKVYIRHEKFPEP